MTVLDEDNFPTLGSGLWWAVQTVTTVGYGDNVPTNVSGQLLAALVMLLGIGFLTVITAAITSTSCRARARAHPSRTSRRRSSCRR
jgi:voltage-gated potassium channel